MRKATSQATVTSAKSRVVAIIGRPNVGKSALFNRIVGRPVAIVEDRPGVTRDRHFGMAEWTGRPFWCIDTGGFEPEIQKLQKGDASAQAAAEIRDGIRRQVRLALEESSQVLFVVDGKTGLHPLDEAVAQLLRGYGHPVHLVVNKADQSSDDDLRWDFSKLGLGEGYPVSALHGRGTDDLLDAVVKDWPADVYDAEALPPEGPLRIAVVGRPNVGKSSLVNALLGVERYVVSAQAGTTRDALDSPLKAHGRDLVLIDTAGIRQKNRITDEVERYSVVRSLRAIDEADVVLLLLDAWEGVNEHDERLAGLAHEAGKACIILANKWDKVSKDNLTYAKCMKDIRSRLKFMDYAPIEFISVTEGIRLGEILPLCIRCGDARATRIPTGKLNRVLEEVLSETSLPSFHGRQLKVYYLAQTGTKPPAFALFINDPKLMHFSTKRRLQSKFREKLALDGTPMILMLRKRK